MSTDESLAKALGWTKGDFEHWRSPGGRYDLAIPEYTGDMDACLRDIVPVLRAREMDWQLEGFKDGSFRAYVLTFEKSVRGMGNTFGPSYEGNSNESAPAAFCEAALAALEATNA